MRAITAVFGADVRKEYRKCKYLFLMLLPVLLYYLIFEYGPLYGAQIAFKDYRIRDGIMGSPWVGFKHFHYLFTASPDFMRIMRNTLLLSFYHIVFGFPAPIVLALLFNEVRSRVFKRVTQTISYLPHFLSWVVLGGLLITILSPTTGVVNQLLALVGIDPIYFLGDPEYFRFTLVVSSIWKEIGWGTIIYLAALAGVDPSLYEAAVVDGAGRWKQIMHITLPGIVPVITIMFIFRIGAVLNAGFDQVLNLYSPNTYSVGDILDTYVYRAGLTQLQYSLTAAVGLFKNVVAFTLVLLTNYVVKKLGQEGIL
ncbi:carbohydrate ABC transporter membrane protein 1, CUT1 family [Paenibacillus sp. UNCCL117]|uniref:ABC transporter permease n=1 Tax=unclassified Paenibacillus TaxID=185978 RepID=UPI00089061FB|nr:MULTISPECIES: ABC transporter permease subunit [unclassified Paenibacillus]SDC13064.1 putative aldouronate transport system permease protein [Paenibacillus sp. cl123]SFW16957.1 carbohydrate ABC transporter membrane protein 1, CUT1 family [Paenibacillus sp. UNCCL117]